MLEHPVLLELTFQWRQRCHVQVSDQSQVRTVVKVGFGGLDRIIWEVLSKEVTFVIPLSSGWHSF